MGIITVRSVILIIDLNEQQSVLKGYKQTYLDYPNFFFREYRCDLTDLSTQHRYLSWVYETTKDLPASGESFHLSSKKLAAWGCHRPELNVQPRPAVEWWEVLPVPLTLLDRCFLLILPLAPPAGTALSSGICHVLALPLKGPGHFAVCELLPFFSPPSLH